MTIEHNNALRSIARQANCEIKKARIHTDSFKPSDRHVKRRF